MNQHTSRDDWNQAEERGELPDLPKPLDDLIHGIWGKPYGSGFRASRRASEAVSPGPASIPLPVDISDETAFPNIGEARRWAQERGLK